MSRTLYPREVLYIGPPPVNRLGRTGFWTSLLGLFTCGLLSPVGLFLSFAAMSKKPRGLAIAGLVLGLIGSLWVAFVGSLAVGGAVSAAALEQARQEKLTQVTMVEAERVVRQYEAEASRLPEGIEGNKLVLPFEDAWQNSLRYDLENDGRFFIRSAGPDGEFDTEDDLLHPEVAERQDGDEVSE